MSKIQSLEDQLKNEQSFNQKLKTDMMDFIRINYNKINKTTKNDISQKSEEIVKL